VRSKAEEILHSGKTVRVRVEHRDFIERIDIEGDFSVHPPDAMREVEKNLIGVEIQSAEEGIADIIADTLSEHHAKLEGATALEIAKVVKKAVS